MSSPKANCLKCDAEFLQATAALTGGYCMKCCHKGPNAQYVPNPEPFKPPPPRHWREILSDIVSREDLLTKQGQELYGIPRDQLPDPVQRWQAAFGLWLFLGNGWSTVLAQHWDDLIEGVAGFKDCGFEAGVRGAEAVFQALREFGIDPESPDAEDEYHSSPPEDMEDELREGIREIDSQVMSTIWASRQDIEEKLIARAHELAQAF